VFEIIISDCYRYSGKIGLKEFLVNKGLLFTLFLRFASGGGGGGGVVMLFFKFFIKNLKIKFGF
jgi:hypothetical protein